jgi:hypothetical protein
MVLLQQLPHDALEHIAFHLEAPDLLSFLSSSRFLNKSLGNKVAFWRNLLWQREGTTSTSSSPFAYSYEDDMQQQQQQQEDDDVNTAKCLKERFLRAACCQRLSNVQWRAIPASSNSNTPSEREGHGCCLLGEHDNLLVITGGFIGDQRVYIKDLHVYDDIWYPINPSIEFAFQPGQSQPPQLFAYGASLTRLNATTAVRFGGFTSGGYAHETSLVAVLTIDANTNRGMGPRFQATWRFVPQKFATTNEQELKELNRVGSLILGRAYHTATLLENRYLYVVGGMKSVVGSVLDPICLDCETWTWIICTPPRHPTTTTTTTSRRLVLLVQLHRADMVIPWYGTSAGTVSFSLVEETAPISCGLVETIPKFGNSKILLLQRLKMLRLQQLRRPRRRQGLVLSLLHHANHFSPRSRPRNGD